MSEQKVKFSQRAKKFFKEIRMEMKKVIWPTRKQLINNTLVVFLACFSIGIVVWLADAVLGLIFSAVFGR
ncbi:MAG: preprotein translocase subunit SecE [Clostridiaceae bacterium]|nr:preprotein translocase subunit SecE [Clostridiaceae bacterium]